MNNLVFKKVKGSLIANTLLEKDKAGSNLEQTKSITTNDRLLKSQMGSILTKAMNKKSMNDTNYGIKNETS
jgi:hypothetical protein